MEAAVQKIIKKRQVVLEDNFLGNIKLLKSIANMWTVNGKLSLRKLLKFAMDGRSVDTLFKTLMQIKCHTIEMHALENTLKRIGVEE